jgi:hypothetical protein
MCSNNFRVYFDDIKIQINVFLCILEACACTSVVFSCILIICTCVLKYFSEFQLMNQRYCNKFCYNFDGIPMNFDVF